MWESGFVETIRNNLRELPDEPVFKNLVRKALEYALRRLGGSNGARTITPGNVDAGRSAGQLIHIGAIPVAITCPTVISNL